MNKTQKLHLSVLIGAFLMVPIGNVLIPYIYWRLNRQKLGDAFTAQAYNILNFQILFSILFIALNTILWYMQIINMKNDINPNFSFLKYSAVLVVVVTIIYPIVVSIIMIKKRKENKLFYPKLFSFFMDE